MHRQWIASALGLAAGIALLLGSLVLSWWSYGDGELAVSIGLREAHMCRQGPGPDACQAVSLQRLSSGGRVGWLRAGTGSYAAAWIAAMLSLASAGLAAAGKRSLLLDRTTLVAAVSAAVVGAMFLIWAPADVARQPALGMPLYFVGATLAGACAILGLLGQRAGARAANA